MDIESFQQARWLAVYGASIALEAHQFVEDGNEAPSHADMVRFDENAAELANLVAVVNGDPKR